MSEIWRPIKGYEGLYDISNLGRIKSLERKVIGRWGTERIVKEKILKPGKNKDGYLQVNLCKDGNVKHPYVHCLVAQAFIPNLENKPEVDHIHPNNPDDPFTNAVWNLRWATHKENSNNPESLENMSKAQKIAKNRPEVKENNSKAIKAKWENPEYREKMSRAQNRPEVKERRSKAQTNRQDLSKIVLQYTLEGEFVAEYPSASEASRQTGYNVGNISHCCTGRYKTAYGYVWRHRKSL